jgi:AGCS family alanine or glycine:cation symporter
MGVGLIIAVLAWLVIIGGIKSIGRAAEKLAPLKVGLYLLGGLVVIVTHAGALPSVIALILREAFRRAGSSAAPPVSA